MARALGSYPICRWFKSNYRYQWPALISVGLYGPVVKRLRHRPFTAVTRVRFSSGSPKITLTRMVGVIFLPKGKTRIEQSNPQDRNSPVDYSVCVCKKKKNIEKNSTKIASCVV